MEALNFLLLMERSWLLINNDKAVNNKFKNSSSRKISLEGVVVVDVDDDANQVKYINKQFQLLQEFVNNLLLLVVGFVVVEAD